MCMHCYLYCVIMHVTKNQIHNKTMYEVNLENVLWSSDLQALHLCLSKKYLPCFLHTHFYPLENYTIEILVRVFLIKAIPEL